MTLIYINLYSRTYMRNKITIILRALRSKFVTEITMTSEGANFTRFFGFVFRNTQTLLTSFCNEILKFIDYLYNFRDASTQALLYVTGISFSIFLRKVCLFHR